MNDFLYLFRSTEEARQVAMGTPEDAQRSLQRWLAWLGKLEESGSLVDPGQPLDITGKVVRTANKLVTDGPYAESKDVVLGFLIVRARDLQEASELAKGCPIVHGGGSVEVRPIVKLTP